MKIITTTNARKVISQMINEVKYSGEIFGIGRRNSIDALLIKFPETYNSELNEITNINTNSRAFDFLKKEKEIENIRKKYWVK